MDIKKALLEEHSKSQAVAIANYIQKNPESLEVLMHLFFHAEYRISQRAAMVLAKLDNYESRLLLPYLIPMIEILQSDCKPGISRNAFRYLQGKVIPESHKGILYDCAMKYLSSVDTPIAVKVFAMTVASEIASEYPELEHEILLELERQFPYSSAGFQSRAKKVIKKIKK